MKFNYVLWKSCVLRGAFTLLMITIKYLSKKLCFLEIKLDVTTGLIVHLEPACLAA